MLVTVVYLLTFAGHASGCGSRCFGFKFLDSAFFHGRHSSKICQRKIVS